jgi:hypothetical protein
MGHARTARVGFVGACMLVVVVLLAAAGSALASPGPLTPNAIGGLDCNGDSALQVTVHRSALCTDIRGFAGVDNANNWNARFYDNGVYIGHDEPDMTFLSNRPGSGGDVTWAGRLPREPGGLPTVTSPGHDTVHTFEDTPAPWFSMAICDPNSYPQVPCTPNSDANAPTCVGGQTSNCFGGGGSAFEEMQLYPPGFAPFVDAPSCDDTHWCAALTIDSLECTEGFATCNLNCEEPVNFAFIQRNGVPAGPPSPQKQDLQSYSPNGQTLLMNPGDFIVVHLFDAPLPGGGRALEVVLRDLSTRQTGFMQASAANGFANTSIADCSGTPFNFQPEYSTAAQPNVVPWGAVQTDIGMAVETGHFTPCTTVTGPAQYPASSTISDTYWNSCQGAYENNSANETGLEPSDAFCFPLGDTHGALHSAPDLVTGCEDDVAQNGDLDFDGTPYYQSDWPVGADPTRRLPSSVVELLPSTDGRQYADYQIQTDVALSESTCSATSTVGCSVPPAGPGGGYPFWSRVSTFGLCTLQFGNVTSGFGVDDLGGEAQYGSDQIATLGYSEYMGPVRSNTCRR